MSLLRRTVANYIDKHGDAPFVAGGWLPPANWTTKPVADRNSVYKTVEKQKQTPQERQATLAADGSTLRVIYGRDRIGAQIANLTAWGTWWVVQCLWGEGEIDGIESLQINDAAPPSGTQITHYLGTAGQTADPLLVSAFATKGGYSDALPNVAYSVLRIPVSAVHDMPQITAIVRGRKLYDPRSGLTEYSTNPALALADMRSNARYGGGRTMDWASVAAVADACDEVVGTAPRRALHGLTFAGRQDLDSLCEALRTYAGCWIVPSAAGDKLIPDRPGFPAASYAHDAGQIVAISPLRKAPLTDIPTVMTVIYTNTAITPWAEDRVIVYADGVLAGTTPRRESEISLPGIQSKTQATREAIERLNKLTLSDLSCDVQVFDEGLRHEPGDIITVSHPVGIAAKPFRVVRTPITSAGRYTLSLVEYDPAAYSDAVEADPTYPDTSLPDPGSPQPPTGLSVVEELVQLADGTWTSRFRATWVAPDWPYVSSYRAVVRHVGAVWASGTVLEAEPLDWVTPPVKEGQSYTVELSTLSRLGTLSSAASSTLTAMGKLLPPTDVPSFSVTVEADGLHCAWGAAGDIDLRGYEIRIGADWATGDPAWTGAATRAVLPLPAPGTHVLWIKAQDRSGNESVNAFSASVTLAAPSTIIPTATIGAASVNIAWGASSSTLPIAAYEVRYGADWDTGTYVARLSARSIDIAVDWGGARAFFVAAIDSAGNVGAAGEVTVVIASPVAPVVSAEIIDNNVLLRWSDAKGSIDVATYEIRRGAVWASAAVKGVQAGRFAALFESVGGTYTYLVRGTDRAGNVGAIGQVVAVVSQPPDFVLNYDQDSAFAGTRSSLIIEDGAMVGPVNTTETWETHFTARAWTTPQAQIDAGYPIFVQPASSPGYYEEVIDYGTTIGITMITVTADRADVAAGVTITPKISMSNTSGTGPWTDYAGVWQAIGTNFRWVKVRLDITGSATALVKINRLNIRMAFKLSDDAGMGYAAAADSGGTIVLLNKTFVDIQSITVTPQGTTAATAIYDFVDTPNPTQFKVLLFNAAGTRISGNFSWSAKGA